MDVGAIGGAGFSMGASGVGGAQMNGVSSVAGSSSAAGPQAAHSVMPGEITARMQALTELMDGFSSAEILLALMMMKGDDKKSGGAGGAALGMLAGMALASQMQQMMPQGCCGNVPDASMQGFGSGMGSSINFTA